MKHYLLPKDGRFYKANLHMHTTVSDGSQTPEEVKDAYKAHGYSAVAFSDHELLLPHPELSDPDFLALTCYEKAWNQPTDKKNFSFFRAVHMNILAKEESNLECPTLNEDTVWLKHSHAFVPEETKKFHYECDYSTESMNDVIKTATEAGYLVTLNHPVWSLQGYEDYIGLKGLWAVECHNTGCMREGFPDTMIPIDDLLRRGERVFPVATDDAHSPVDNFGGWVMVKAEKLDYPTFIRALESGDFYASAGPEIRDLYIENGILHLSCSDAQSVDLVTDRRSNRRFFPEDGGYLTKLDIDLTRFLYLSQEENAVPTSYFRITVTDPTGKQAHSRAYFLDEFL